MTDQTLDQKRARHALACVNALEGREGKAGNYVSYVNALPAAILMNGLGQALATERAANDKAHHKLANHVANWLLSEEAHSRYRTGGSEKEPVQRLLDNIVEGDQRSYLWAQAEALAYLTWLKRFANAFLNEPKDSHGG